MSSSLDSATHISAEEFKLKLPANPGYLPLCPYVLGGLFQAVRDSSSISSIRLNLTAEFNGYLKDYPSKAMPNLIKSVDKLSVDSDDGFVTFCIAKFISTQTRLSHEVSDPSLSLRKGVECGVCFVSPVVSVESVVKTSINKLFKQLVSMYPRTEAVDFPKLHTLICNESFKVARLYSSKVEDFVLRL